MLVEPGVLPAGGGVGARWRQRGVTGCLWGRSECRATPWGLSVIVGSLEGMGSALPVAVAPGPMW